MSGRTFHDDADLAEQCQRWLTQVNAERPSDATGQTPAALLPEEQRKFGALPEQAHDYGFFDCVVVSREGLVSIETNRYSVPAQHVVERDLAHYEYYVANRDSMGADPRPARGGRP